MKYGLKGLSGDELQCCKDQMTSSDKLASHYKFKSANRGLIFPKREFVELVTECEIVLCSLKKICTFRLASLLALLVGLNLSFLIDAPVWFFKITKVALFESVEVFCKDPFLALLFSLSSSMIFRFLCLLSILVPTHQDACKSWKRAHFLLIKDLL